MSRSTNKIAVVTGGGHDLRHENNRELTLIRMHECALRQICHSSIKRPDAGRHHRENHELFVELCQKVTLRGELLSNAKYHSGGRAFASAQFFPSRNLVRIAVADDGMGIRRSFANTSRETDASTADAAIRLALMPGISSALLRPVSQPYGGQNHRGVGLSITRILTKEAGGRLTIATENGWFDELNGHEIRQTGAPHHVPGTMVALSLHRDQIADYAAMHAAAMSEIGMADLDTRGTFLD